SQRTVAADDGLSDLRMNLVHADRSVATLLLGYGALFGKIDQATDEEINDRIVGHLRHFEVELLCRPGRKRCTFYLVPDQVAQLQTLFVSGALGCDLAGKTLDAAAYLQQLAAAYLGKREIDGHCASDHFRVRLAHHEPTARSGPHAADHMMLDQPDRL